MSDGPANEADLNWADHDHSGRAFRRKQISDAASEKADRTLSTYLGRSAETEYWKG